MWGASAAHEHLDLPRAQPTARLLRFQCRWADGLEQYGLRSEQITLPPTRAEMGGLIGLRLAFVSRALVSSVST